jgi:hypothetical protein
MTQSLRDEIEALRRQLAERDETIRVLSVALAREQADHPGLRVVVQDGVLRPAWPGNTWGSRDDPIVIPQPFTTI